MLYDVDKYVHKELIGGDTPFFHFSHMKNLPPPVIKCHATRATTCPAGKTSYWRSFGVNTRPGGCGNPKALCGAEKWPSVGPPHYVVEPATRAELIKFL